MQLLMKRITNKAIMPFKALVRFLTVVLHFLMPILTPAFAQQVLSDSTKLALTDYKFVQFITTSGVAPNNVIKRDNNGEIVLACVEGKNQRTIPD